MHTLCWIKARQHWVVDVAISDKNLVAELDGMSRDNGTAQTSATATTTYAP
ncbi:capsular biosynthesis protein (plasmid) [Acetobacter orientalis]|uniref:Capsular biosynthesis protein n=1 Tax=Acetobacter orientalis TaxID=146474 RepID=A0A2Z5ZN69_9PROT|nr:capsular biosynthesis protein [Acetobacter orientalis]